NVVGILLAYMILDLTIVPLDNEVFILYDEAAECLWKIPLIAALLLIGEYSSIFVFCQYKKVLIERERVIAREQQLKQLQYRFEESQLLYGNLRSLRHDMKNHMQTIQGLVAAGESKRASEYVEKLNDAIDGIDCKYCTGNALCDIVLNNKYRQAKKDEIKLSVSFRFVNGISDFDMGIILSNLCDNAIEACRKLPVSDRRIEITLMEKGPCVLLTVTNPYDGKLLFDVGEDLPMSCKQNGSDEKDINNKSKEHGIGLRNVSAIADAYLGNLQIETSDQIFSATVMLQKRNGCPVTT
ncbi:MAG: GHKL domain-containing protein, partial [Clostridiales bacterium]|nr:GHKL domain-containing protein [Clostridiales bacterium]